MDRKVARRELQPIIGERSEAASLLPSRSTVQLWARLRIRRVQFRKACIRSRAAQSDQAA